eukprot:6111737-Pleurochrysis_carterae.AAC.1
MGWTRGNGCVRLIVRSLDLTEQFNSPLFSRDALFYIGNDKHADLAANFRVGAELSINSILKESMVAKPISDSRLPVSCRIECSSCLSVPSADDAGEVEEAHDLFAGGDMAAAHSGWAMDSPIARYGCCFYCPLGKPSWFDSGKCASVARRNLVFETLAAHLNPFTLYPALSSLVPHTVPSCPHCEKSLTPADIEKEMDDMANMSDSALAQYLLNHRKTHCGKELHSELE